MVGVLVRQDGRLTVCRRIVRYLAHNDNIPPMKGGCCNGRWVLAYVQPRA